MGTRVREFLRDGGVGREVLAGLLNALTLLPGVIVVPSMLFQAGMDFTGAYTSLLLVSMAGTVLVGRMAGSPVVLVPGIAVASWLVYGEIISCGQSWQAVLGASFLAAVLGTAFLLSPLRKVFLEAVPAALRSSLSGALGLMLVFQGLVQGRLITGSPMDVVMPGNLSDPVAYLSLLGLCIVFALLVNGIPGALAIGTLVTAIVALLQGFWEFPRAPFLLPEGLDRTVLQMDVSGGLSLPGVVFPLMLVTLVESLGTTQALCHAYPERVPQPSRKLLLCVLGTGMAGALLGSLPPRPAAESAAGLCAGGRKGWASYGTALFFLPMLFCEPVIREMASFGAITAPAMVGAGFLMLSRMKKVSDGDMADAAASWCLFLLLPLSHDVAVGLGCALIAHVALKCLCGKSAEVPRPEACMAAVFFAYFFCLMT